MLLPNFGALRAVAERLDKLGLGYAFVGGSIVSLLVDHPELSSARPTDDVDVILEVVTSERYSEVEVRIRKLGFQHDVREKAPLCRWTLEGLTVDNLYEWKQRADRLTPGRRGSRSAREQGGAASGERAA
jgi:hypothetical protein